MQCSTAELTAQEILTGENGTLIQSQFIYQKFVGIIKEVAQKLVVHAHTVVEFDRGKQSPIQLLPYLRFKVFYEVLNFRPLELADDDQIEPRVVAWKSARKIV